MPKLILCRGIQGSGKRVYYEKIGVILKQHKEGEEFFNALDFMIKGDRSILEDFLSFFMNDAGRNLELPDTGLIVSGGFGYDNVW